MHGTMGKGHYCMVGLAVALLIRCTILQQYIGVNYDH